MAKSSKVVSNMVAKQLAADAPVFDPDKATDEIEKDCQIMKAYNWHNAFATEAKEREWYHKFAKENELFEKDELTRIKTMPAKMFVKVGFLCHMYMNGFPLDDVEWPKNRINKLTTKITKKLAYKPVEKKNEKPVVSVQDRILEKAAELACEIQIMMDEYIGSIHDIKKSEDSEHVNIESFINVNKISNAVATKIVPWIEEDSKEWNEVVGTKDVDLKEGYSIYTVSEQKRIVKMYKSVIDQLNARAATKAVRKTRKKKVKTPKQLVSKLQFLDTTKEYGGISSIDPEKIIGKERVILFNIKYRQITILEADNPHIGLSVKGTTITGINESTSVSKKIREKYVKDLISTCSSKGIRAIRKAYKDINAKESVANGRVNKDTLILKVL